MVFILITTKRGEEGRAKIDVSFTATLKSASKLPNKFDSFDALAARNKAVVHELGLMPSSWSYMTPYETLLKYRNPANLEEFERYPTLTGRTTCSRITQWLTTVRFLSVVVLAS